MTRWNPAPFWLMLATAIASICARAQTSAPLLVTNLQHTSDSWLLGWGTNGTGTAYTVQYQDTLQDVIWRTPDSSVPFPVTSNAWADLSNTNDSRFFRVLAVPAAHRGEVISATYSNTVPTNVIAFLAAAEGVPITPQYAVRLYKLDYETITPLGARTVASGVLLLPDGESQPLPLVSYQHGTITQTNQAPSSMNLAGEVSIGIAFATTGYAAAVPDYLGLGDSPGFQPYLHARSEATACVDMLRAARAFCASNGVALSDKLFLCGYSQGGHATLALLRELERYHTNEFSVTACAPMEGPYDLSGVTTSNLLSGVPQPNPYYFLYLLGAYQDIYHFAPSLGDLFVPPYDSTLPPLLGGNVTSDAINAAMPANHIPSDVLKPEFLSAFRLNPRHPLRLALQDNDLYRWTPRSSLRLFHCAADQDVLLANAEVAVEAFQQAGANQVQLIDPLPTGDHSSCVLPSFVQVKEWFDSLR
ncbi:MAG TPA: lipase family protein, partial [Verrucomicrobiae bacterium]|nr:lipase family protein [Verrucomicrobiae bacterium]